MIQGLKDGTIDVIATDHAPHTIDEKDVEYTQAPFGIVGLETSVGLSMTELLHKKVLTLMVLIQKLSRIRAGYSPFPPSSLQKGIGKHDTARSEHRVGSRYYQAAFKIEELSLQWVPPEGKGGGHHQQRNRIALVAFSIIQLDLS